MEQNSLISETKAVGPKTKTKLPVFGVWLTLPPSTISFCKSVDAMINMRMACRRVGRQQRNRRRTTHTHTHTHICTLGCLSETGHVYGALRRNCIIAETRQSAVPSSGLCSWKGFCERERICYWSDERFSYDCYTSSLILVQIQRMIHLVSSWCSTQLFKSSPKSEQTFHWPPVLFLLCPFVPDSSFPNDRTTRDTYQLQQIQ